MHSYFKENLVVSIKLNMSYNTAILLLDIFPREINICISPFTKDLLR